MSSARRLPLLFCLSPATCRTLALLSRWLGPVPCNTSPGRGCPLCCGCFKGPRPVFSLGHSSVASCAPGKAQPALNSARTRSKPEGEQGEGKRFSVFYFFWFCFLTICPFLFFSSKSVSPWAGSHTPLHPSRPFAEGDSRFFCSGEPGGLGYQGLSGRASHRAARVIAGIQRCFGAAWPVPGGAMGQRCNWGEKIGVKLTYLTAAPARARTRSCLCVNEEHWELFCLCCSCNAKSECC